MSDLPLLIEAARAAGALMLERRGAIRTRRKPDGSPVTDADLAVDALLHDTLCGARPDYGWLSEESTDDLARLGAWRTFVVDPIDGTTAYVNGDPWFAVSIAVVQEGRPIAGVVFAPQLDQLYAAQRGGGATLNGAPIHAAATTRLDGARFLGDPCGGRGERWDEIAVSRCNAIALRMARVASGETDAAVSPAPKNEWDIAAGVILCHEAGAAAVDASGAPLRFNTRTAKAPGLISCAPALEPLIRERLAATAAPNAPGAARHA